MADEAKAATPKPGHVMHRGKEKQLLRHKLIVGSHQGEDFSQDADERGNRPLKLYRQGSAVVDVEDLEKKHGSEKFKRLGVQRAPLAPATSNEGASFPGGQVSTGFQETTSLSDGRTVTGLKDTLGVGPNEPLHPEAAQANKEGGTKDVYDHMEEKELRAEASDRDVEVAEGDTADGIREKLRAEERSEE